MSVRGLDDAVVERLRVRAAQHGRSMEAEIRSILVAAAGEGQDLGLFGALVNRIGAVGGVELDLPERRTTARAADLTA